MFIFVRLRLKRMEELPNSNKLNDDNLTQWYKMSDNEAADDAKFYVSELKKYSEPMLEVGFANGFVLTELLKSGIQCDGLESSEKQLTICKQNLEASGLTSTLYNADFSDFISQKKYKTIFVPRGTFCLITDYNLAKNCLKNYAMSLELGGTLLLETFVPWNGIVSSKEKIWKIGSKVTDENSGETFIYSYCESFDLSEQIRSVLGKYELFADGELVASRLDNVKSRWYGINEIKLMLQEAGFSKVDYKNIFVKNQFEYSTLFTATKLD